MRLFDISDRKTAAVPPQAIRVNGTEISDTAIAREIQNHPANSPGTARAAAVRALVVRELLLDEAARLGLKAEPATAGDGSRETDEKKRWCDSSLKRKSASPIQPGRNAAASFRRIPKGSALPISMKPPIFYSPPPETTRKVMQRPSLRQTSHRQVKRSSAALRRTCPVPLRMPVGQGGRQPWPDHPWPDRPRLRGGIDCP